ncbi:MAG: hypothetical protein ABIG10_01195, partial [bacterium]
YKYMNSKALSITIDKNNFKFLDNISKNEKKPRSEVIDDILSKYRKFILRKEIEAGFKAQTKEDLENSMSDFSDYLALIEKNA